MFSAWAGELQSGMEVKGGTGKPAGKTKEDRGEGAKKSKACEVGGKTLDVAKNFPFDGKGGILRDVQRATDLNGGDRQDATKACQPTAEPGRC